MTVIMNYFLILVSAFLIQSQAYSQTAKETFMETLNYAQASSPFSDQINWNDIKAHGLSFIEGRQGGCVAASAIANVLVPPLFQLDHHSFVTLNGFDDDCPLPDINNTSEEMSEWLNLDSNLRNSIRAYTGSFHGKRIGDYSYVYVPAGYAWSQEDIDKRIKEGREALEDAQLDTSKGVILDFRHNWGGNNVPMLLALSTLLPDDILFKFSPDISISSDKDGNRLIMDYEGEITDYGKYDNSTPVRRLSKPAVILINGFTGSSGVISAYSLHNAIQQSIIVGETSSESLSVNESYPLPDGNYFNLMVLRVYNKDNLLAPLRLDVDRYVAHDYTQMFGNKDPQIDVALSVLAQSALSW